MAKKLSSLILVVFCMVLLCGCANIEYQRVTDDTGKIVDKITVELNEKELASKGMSTAKIQSLKNDIHTDFLKYEIAINTMKSELKANNTDVNLDYDLGITVQSSGWVPVSQGVSKIYVQVVYLNSVYLQKLNGTEDVESEEDDSTQIISNLFISKYMMYADNVFMDVEETLGVDSKNFFEYYSANYDEATIEDVTLTQIYGTTDNRLKSNADYKANIEGINYHLWEIDTKNSGYKTLKLNYYYTTAVGTGWYIVALGISFLMVVVLGVVCFIKKRNDSKYKVKLKLEDVIVKEMEKDE